MINYKKHIFLFFYLGIQTIKVFPSSLYGFRKHTEVKYKHIEKESLDIDRVYQNVHERAYTYPLELQIIDLIMNSII